MRELFKRVFFAGSPASAGFALDGVLDPNWLRIWLVCYGGSLTILATYVMSVVAKFAHDRSQ